MGFGGRFLTHLNSSRGDSGRSLSEGSGGDQNGDFGFGWQGEGGEGGGFFNFSPRQLFLNYSGHKLKSPTSEDLNHRLALFKIWDLNSQFAKSSNFSSYSIKL